MSSGKQRWRRLSAAAGAVVLIQACTPRSDPEPEPAPAPAPPAAPALPVAAPPLGRAELLSAVDAATSAYASGQAYPAQAAELAGRRFAVRLPFGCAGESSDGYTYDPEKRTLRLSVAPQVWTDAEWARALVGTEATEAIEGFWIRWPWMKSEACPAIGPGAGALPTAPAPRTVGLAQVFEKGGSRLQRRGARPYEVTRKLEPDQVPGVGGFRLMLEGRFAADGEGSTVSCRSTHPDQRPVCLVRVEIDRVAFENAAGEVLAEWRS